ncbi:MAG: hypothetical protein AB8B69_09765 [Chitinophagales bacterium]
MVTFLQFPSYKARRLTAAKLGQLKDINALPFLLKSLDDAVLKVAETALYAIETIAHANNYSIDLQKKKQVLKKRKEAICKLRLLKNFKFGKSSRVPDKKELMNSHHRRLF